MIYNKQMKSLYVLAFFVCKSYISEVKLMSKKILVRNIHNNYHHPHVVLTIIQMNLKLPNSALLYIIIAL